MKHILAALLLALFALAGWFPNPERDRGFYEEAARVHAPDVPTHFLDGNDDPWRVVAQLRDALETTPGT